MADVESINHFFSITCDRQFSFAVTQLFSQVIGVNGNMSCVAGPLCFSHVLDLPALQLHFINGLLGRSRHFFLLLLSTFSGVTAQFFHGSCLISAAKVGEKCHLQNFLFSLHSSSSLELKKMTVQFLHFAACMVRDHETSKQVSS